MERYPNIKVGTYKPMRIKDILIKNRFFCCTPAFWNMSKTHNDLKFGKEMVMLMVFDISLLPLDIMRLIQNLPSDFWIHLFETFLGKCLRGLWGEEG